MPAPILIVDDDPTERQRLAEGLAREGFKTESFGDGAAALARLENADGDRIRLMILDLVMPELDGIGVLRRIAEKGLPIKVIAQATPAGADRVSEAIRAGALDFLVKPASPERLAVSVRNALRLATLEDELARANRTTNGLAGFDDIVATDPGMERALVLARRAATSDLPILIEGEPGTGKSLLAQAIHAGGDRSTRPFAAVRCEEDEPARAARDLFGTPHDPGRIVKARAGTVLIQDIERLSAEAQAQLMGLLSTGAVDSGDARSVRPEIRLIATTSDDLQARVRAGLFREDLYYRLSALPIRLPPLRARREAIPELAIRFATRSAGQFGRPVQGIAPDALDVLMRRPFPGNVRQLEAVILRAVMMAKGSCLTAADLAAPACEPDQTTRDTAVPAASRPVAATLSALTPAGDVRPLAEIETAMIELALERYRGRMATVARKLGIGRSTLYRKLKELGISESAEKIAAE
jgi:DNA-binding NtrC family response regulator